MAEPTIHEDPSSGLPAMSEILKLTAEDLVAFLSARGVKGNCTVCSANDWSILDASSRGYIKLISEGVAGKQLLFPMLSMTCRNCANCLLFNAVHVAQWKLGKKVSADIER